MSRYPSNCRNVIPASSRKYTTEQRREVVKQESALDYFRDTWEKNDKPSPIKTTTEDYLRNLSIKNEIYGWTSTRTVKNEAKKPLKELMTSGISGCKVIDRWQELDVSVSASNRLNKIDLRNVTLEYENCTKVVDVSDKNEHTLRVRNGYKVYDLYRFNPLVNNDTVVMTVMVK